MKANPSLSRELAMTKVAKGIVTELKMQEKALISSGDVIAKASNQGYKGSSAGEAKEWLRAKEKGLDMSQEARISRAQAMGFDTSKIWYHGTGSDIKAFDSDMIGKNFNVDEEGFFFTSNTAHEEVQYGNGKKELYEGQYSAGAYAKNASSKEGSPNIMPIFLAIQNPYTTKDAIYSYDLNKDDPFSDEGHPQDFLDMNKRDIIEIAKSQGNDGIDLRQGKDEVAVVFEPNQIRSIFAAFDPDFADSGNLLASAQSERFYSALHRAILSNKIPKAAFATPSVLKQWLNNSGNVGKIGVKPDEIYWSGINDYLDIKAAAKEKVTQADMDAFMRESGTVKTVDVVLSETDEAEIQVFLDDEMGEGYTREEAIEYLSNEEGKPKYANSNYVVPGGKNAREIVVTIPTVEKYNESDSTHYGDVGEGKQVMWMRMDSRTDSNGNEGIFVNEFQSQRGQHGRTKGFKGPSFASQKIEKLPEDYKVVSDDRNEKMFTVKDRDGNLLLGSEGKKILKSTKEDAALWGVIILNAKIAKQRYDAVPPAPFITDKNNKATDAYISLLMKKAVSQAIDEGKGFVAWTTGSQQADFYSLSKSIEKISAGAFKPDLAISRVIQLFPVNDDEKIVITLNRDGKIGTASDNSWVGKDLADVIGKPLTDRIQENPTAHSIEGVNLDIGGAWTQTMYGDETGMDAQGKPSLITQAAIDIAKKFGGKVGSVEIAGMVILEEIGGRVASNGTEYWLEGSEYQQIGPRFNSYIEADNYRGLLKEGRGKQPALIITPSMAAKIRDEGMPLFSFAGERAQTADKYALETAQQRLKLYNDALSQIKDIGYDNEYSITDKGNDGKLKFQVSRNGKYVDRFLTQNEAETFISDQQQERNELVKIAKANNKERVRQETGWHQAKDGKYRFEIDDSEASIKKPWPTKGQSFGSIHNDQFKATGSVTVGDILEHPKLFAAYPGLADIAVTTQYESGASYSSASSVDPAMIEIGEDEPMSNVMSILLHELQHAVQHTEGFSSGGNLNGSTYLTKGFTSESEFIAAIKDLQKQALKAQRDFEKASQAKRFKGQVQQTKILLKKVQELEEKVKSLKTYDTKEAYAAYHKLAGEVEARNTQSRQAMTAADRKAIEPSVTQDVSDRDQIVIWNGKVMGLFPAWHGTGESGANIDKFDMGKVGTGTGRQTNGFGLYYSDFNEIGKFYRDILGGEHYFLTDAHGRFYEKSQLPDIFSNGKIDNYLTKAQENLVKKLVNDPVFRGDFEKSFNAGKNLNGVAKYWKDNGFKFVVEEAKGATYNVEIKPEKDHFMDLGKPLSEQGDYINSALYGNLPDAVLQADDVMAQTGREIYDAFSKQLGSDKAASEHLLSIGIRGNKINESLLDIYKGRTDGTHYDYIVFSADDVVNKGKVSNEVAKPVSLPGWKTSGESVKFSKYDGLNPSREKWSGGDTINIDGVERPTKNSDGKLIHPTEEGLRNFWNGFSDSKALDKQGRPVRVYHGTGRNIGNLGEVMSGNFDEFDAVLSGKSSKTGAPNGTFFFNDDPEVASSYTVKWRGDFSEQYKDNANVMPVYLNIKKPLKVSAKGDNWREILYNGEYQNINEIARIAKESGKYDGVIVTRIVDNGVGKTSGKPSTTYVAFNPNQIKSAIGNTGEFSEQSNNILYSMASTIEDAMQTDFGQRATGIIDKVHDWLNVFDPLGTLTNKNEYLKTRYLTQGKIADIDLVSRNLYDTFKSAGEDKAKILHYLITKDANSGSIANPELRRQAEDTKSLFIDIGQEMVDKGLLSEETYAKNKGGYLPQLYLRFMLKDQDIAALGTGKKPSSLVYLKNRSYQWQVAPNGDVHLHDVETGVLLPDDKALSLGPINDPGYLASKGYAVQMRDMAILDWLSEISQNNQWILPESLIEWKGKKVTPYWLKSEAQTIRKQAIYYTDENKFKALDLANNMDEEADKALEGYENVPDGWKRIPNIKRYGAMRGLLVKSEIYDDIIGASQINAGDISNAEKLLGNGGLITKATQWWKWAKVAANPPSQIRNFISNGVLLHLSGVSFHMVPTRVIEAIKDIRSNGRYWQIAKKYGVTESTFAAKELPRIDREMLDLQAQTQGDYSWAHVRNLFGKLVDKTGDMYQLSEAIFKTAKIIDEMKKGKSEGDAILAAQEALFDYSLVSPSVRYLRNAPVGSPFLTFAIKALPQMVKVATTHPLRFAPYIAIPYVLTALIASSADVDDDDVDKLKKALPEWLQKQGHAYILPYKDSSGNWEAMDFGYFFPWTQWTELAKNTANGDIGEAFKGSGLLGGPLPDLITAAKTGIDPFTQKEIMDERDPPEKQMAALMGYLYRMAMPTWITDIGAAGKLHEALTGYVDKKTGAPKTTVTQALLRFAGVNLYSINPDESRAANIRRMKYEIQDVKARRTGLLKDRNLTQQERQDIFKEYNEIIKQRYLQMQEYAKDSEVNPRLKTN